MSIAHVTSTVSHDVPWEWNGRQMSAAEFDTLSGLPAGYRYELINGVLIVSPFPGIGERDANDFLGYLLRTYQLNSPLGKALTLTAPEQDLRFGSTRRRCDRAIWCGGTNRPDPVHDLPRIVIEIVSQRQRDRQRDYEIKRDEYLRAGIREYWMIDRFDRKLSVSAAAQTRTYNSNDSYQTELLPGFELNLADLFKLTDRWTGQE